jgi:hypothetical protein
MAKANEHVQQAEALLEDLNLMRMVLDETRSRLARNARKPARPKP